MRILIFLILAAAIVITSTSDAKETPQSHCEAALAKNFARRNALIRSRASSQYRLQLYKSPEQDGIPEHYIAIFTDKSTVNALVPLNIHEIENMREDMSDIDFKLLASVEPESKPYKLPLSPLQEGVNNLLRHNYLVTIMIAMQYDLSMLDVMLTAVSSIGMSLTSFAPDMIEADVLMEQFSDRQDRAHRLAQKIYERILKKALNEAATGVAGVPVYAVFTDTTTDFYLDSRITREGFTKASHYAAPTSAEDE